MVVINGVSREGCEGKLLSELLREEGYRAEQVAAEINGEIIPRSQFDRTVLKDGDHLEIVSFVGGG